MNSFKFGSKIISKDDEKLWYAAIIWYTYNGRHVSPEEVTSMMQMWYGRMRYLTNMIEMFEIFNDDENPLVVEYEAMTRAEKQQQCVAVDNLFTNLLALDEPARQRERVLEGYIGYPPGLYLQNKQKPKFSYVQMRDDELFVIRKLLTNCKDNAGNDTKHAYAKHLWARHKGLDRVMGKTNVFKNLADSSHELSAHIDRVLAEEGDAFFARKAHEMHQAYSQNVPLNHCLPGESTISTDPIPQVTQSMRDASLAAIASASTLPTRRESGRITGDEDESEKDESEEEEDEEGQSEEEESEEEGDKEEGSEEEGSEEEESEEEESPTGKGKGKETAKRQRSGTPAEAGSYRQQGPKGPPRGGSSTGVGGRA